MVRHQATAYGADRRLERYAHEALHSEAKKTTWRTASSQAYNGTRHCTFVLSEHLSRRRMRITGGHHRHRLHHREINVFSRRSTWPATIRDTRPGSHIQSAASIVQSERKSKPGGFLCCGRWCGRNVERQNQLGSRADRSGNQISRHQP